MFDLQPSRTGWSMAVSFGINAVLLAAALLLPSLFPPRTVVNAFLPEEPNEHIVWLAEPGPGGGGGGGGNKMKEPPRIGRAAGQGQDHGSRGEAAGADAEASREGARARRTAEHSGGDARCVRRVAARRHRYRTGFANSVAGIGQRWRSGNRARHRASAPAPVRVSAPEPAAARAAALTVRATVSRHRSSCRK